MWAVCRHQNRKKISTKILTRFFVCFLSNLTIWQPCVTMLTDGQDNSSLPYHKTLIYSCRCHAVVDKILKRSYKKKIKRKKTNNCVFENGSQAAKNVMRTTILFLVWQYQRLFGNYESKVYTGHISIRFDRLWRARAHERPRTWHFQSEICSQDFPRCSTHVICVCL